MSLFPRSAVPGYIHLQYWFRSTLMDCYYSWLFDWPREKPDLISGSMCLLAALASYLIFACLYSIVDILGARKCPSYRTTPPSLPFGLPYIGHAVYFASNMPAFSYGLK